MNVFEVGKVYKGINNKENNFVRFKVTHRDGNKIRIKTDDCKTYTYNVYKVRIPYGNGFCDTETIGTGNSKSTIMANAVQ